MTIKNRLSRIRFRIKNERKLNIKVKLFLVLFLSAVIFTVFSIPIISVIAPLGNILLPGNGVWRVPGEVPLNETVYNENLTAEVIVYRDEWGIPHVYASTEDDMSFALGYIHAQDRLFQMDMARRQVRGKMSEVIGEAGLESDKLSLAMGMEYWANKTLEAILAEEAAGKIDYLNAFRRYVDGVNYYVNSHLDELPLEYQLLGFKPLEWSMLDTVCFNKYMSRMLSWQYYDLYRLINYEALGADDYNELFPVFNPNQIPICPNYGSFNDSELLEVSHGNPSPASSSVAKTIAKFLSDVEQIPSEKELIDMDLKNIIGSNNWVVDGNKSSTGKPILCNDMHLAWMLPGIWYEGHASVTSTDLNVYGYTIAGIPLPIVGHNDYIAWGITNTGYDVMDWYYYDVIDDSKYNYSGTPTEYTYRTYTIPVKGGASVDFTVKETVHGPVLNDFLGSAIPASIDDKVLAYKWTGNNVTWEVKSIYEFSHAKNRAEFDNASSTFYTPSSNIVYADIYGNIGIRPTGLVPIRDNSHGKFPHDGSAGEGEWVDYIPFDDLPHTENPSQNYLASANQIVAGPNYTQDYPSYPDLQNGAYATGYRARRINEVLNSSANGTVGVEFMKELQLDVKSVMARSMTPYIINATEAYAQKTAVMNDTLTQLKNWDYDMDKNIAAPLIYRKWRDYMEDMTFEDEWIATGASIRPQLNILHKLMGNESSKWFDDITTTAVVEKRDDIIVAALIAALENITEYYGNEDVASWRWGEVHKLVFPHLAGSSFPTLGAGPFEGDGSGYTVNPSGVGIDQMNDVRYAGAGASQRWIVDFSDLENSYSCIPSGQRGLSNSKHYKDQLEELFLKGKYHRQYFYKTAAEFPRYLIESEIHFLPGNDINEFIQIGIAFLAAGFIIGIVGIVLIKRFTTISETNLAESPKKLNGGDKV